MMPEASARPALGCGRVRSLDPYPSGWYAACFSAELPPGAVRSLRFMGKELVLFRTRGGLACALDAYCPHLGAHLGRGGTVEGEELRCPFHGFRFDGAGSCVATGYGSKPPPAAHLRSWPVRETNAIVLLYHSQDAGPPTWEVPALENSGWSQPVFRRFELSAHPQQTTENSVDLGHFEIVHGYESVRLVRDVVVDGPYLSTRYLARRPAPLLGRRWMLEFEFETHIHGLGYSLVDLHVRNLEIRARIWVLPTPIDADRMALRLAASGDGTSGATVAWLRAVPPRLRGYLIARGLLEALAYDAGQDFEIWRNGAYVHPPALAQGDGPIGRYRSWAARFYESTPGSLV